MKPNFSLRHILEGYRSLGNPHAAERYINQFVCDYVFDDHGAYLKSETGRDDGRSPISGLRSQREAA